MHRGGSARFILLWLLGLVSLLFVIFSIAWYKPEIIRGINYIEDYLSHREKVRYLVASFGSLAPVAFIGLQALQVIFSPVPGEATGFIGGFLFGTLPGFVYSTVGLTLGSWMAFAVARLFSPAVARRFGKTKAYSKISYLVEHEGIIIAFIMFLLPGFPKDYLCYLLGLSLMPPSLFMIISTVGRLPGTLMLTLQGSKVFEHQYAGFFVLLGLSLAVALPSYLYREKLISRMTRNLNARKNKPEC